MAKRKRKSKKDWIIFSYKNYEKELIKIQKGLGAKKHDYGKPRLELIIYEFEELMARVLSGGAQKYGDYNWTQGMNLTRYLGALKRHAGKWEMGESYDYESGLHHMGHVAVNAMFIFASELYNLGKDNRWKRPKKTKKG